MKITAARKTEGLAIRDVYEGRDEDKRRLRLRLQQEPTVTQPQSETLEGRLGGKTLMKNSEKEC